MAMDINTISSRLNVKQYFLCLPSAEKGRTSKEKDVSGSAYVDKNVRPPLFVNHAGIAWHESRKKWVGNQSQQPQRIEKDPIISWSASYEDLLSTNEPFSEPIPLPEMVDFLVDIWHDEGLYD